MQNVYFCIHVHDKQNNRAHKYETIFVFAYTTLMPTDTRPFEGVCKRNNQKWNVEIIKNQ